ncbi:MAG: LysR substrate-binding domain-containing protein [Bacteroidota bacterium]
MTLTQLEYIIAVDTHRHFAKAAEKCFVTQPTLSMQIQKLEDYLGVTIFDRRKQPVTPTEIGKRIIEQAKVVINESKRISEIISDEKNVIVGELKVGIIPTIAPYLLPLFISRFIEKYPGIKLQVEELITEQIAEKLRNETLDVGILVTPYEDDLLVDKPIFFEEFFAYVSHRHEFYNKQVIQADEIDPEEVWLLTEGHCFREQVLNVCHSRTSADNLKFHYESGSLEALRRMVDKHGGITFLPELATLDFDKFQQSKIKRFKDPKPIREVSIVINKTYLKKKLVDTFYQEVKDSIPGYLQSEKEGEVVK